MFNCSKPNQCADVIRVQVQGASETGLGLVESPLELQNLAQTMVCLGGTRRVGDELQHLDLGQFQVATIDGRLSTFTALLRLGRLLGRGKIAPHRQACTDPAASGQCRKQRGKQTAACKGGPGPHGELTLPRVGSPDLVGEMPPGSIARNGGGVRADPTIRGTVR